MIISRVKTFGYYLCLLGFWGGLFFFTYLTNAAINKTVVPIGSNQVPALIFSYTVDVLLTSISVKYLWDSKIISIDTDLKQIKMTNRFTRFSKIYDFNYFDNSIIINEPIKGGWNRNFYLLKDKKVTKRICDLIYSNQMELEDALKEIKSLGEKNYSYLNSAKILFGLKIIE